MGYLSVLSSSEAVNYLRYGFYLISFIWGSLIQVKFYESLWTVRRITVNTYTAKSWYVLMYNCLFRMYWQELQNGLWDINLQKSICCNITCWLLLFRNSFSALKCFNTRTPGIFITLERPMYHFWYKRGIPLLKCRWRLILAYFCFKRLFRPHIRLNIVNFSWKYKIKSCQIKK